VLEARLHGAGRNRRADHDALDDGSGAADLLKRGDILTHTFTIPTPRVDNLFGGPTQADKVLPQILELKDRGIFTEGQMVNSHHMFEVSEKAFAQGWIPDLRGPTWARSARTCRTGFCCPGR
jgi:hypothetical protein